MTHCSNLIHFVTHRQEITGHLPPELPLGPNETPPRIRRKVRTEFTLDDKLLLEPKSEEEQKLSKLELDFEIQSKIVTATLKLMNEPGLKRRIRKQRKANYDVAQAKLSTIQKELLGLKNRLQQDSKLKYRTKKQLIEEHLSPNLKSVTQLTPMVTRIPASVLQANTCALNGNNGSSKAQSSVTDGKITTTTTNGSIHIKEMPLSSLVEPRISSSKEGISKSRAKKRGKLMMSGGSVTALVSASSSNVSSSNTAAVKSIERSSRVPSASQSVPSSPSLAPRDLKGKPASTSSGHDDMDLVRGIIFNHHRQDNLLCDSSIGIIHQRSYSQGLPSKHQKAPSDCIHLRQVPSSSSSSSSPPSILKNTSRTAPSTPMKSKVTNVDPESAIFSTKSEALARSNSLENVRRKSYISAVLSPTAIDHPFNGTHFYNQAIHGAKSLPKNPPPPVPVTASMAKRPLPPTPSLSQAINCQELNAQSQLADAVFKIPSSELHARKRYDSGQSTGSNGAGVDISSRAVRSSLIRTPVGITISTTSSADPGSGASSNGIIMTNVCTDSASSAHTNATCTSQLHDSHNANSVKSAFAVCTTSSSESPIPSPILKGRNTRARAFSGSNSGATGIVTELSDSVTQLSSSHSCCSSRSASNAPSPTPSSASTLALQQQQQQQQNSSITFAPPPSVNCTYAANDIHNVPVDVTNSSSCNLLQPTHEMLDLPQQAKDASSTMASTASVNSCISNSNAIESMPPPTSLPPRKPKKSQNLPRTVISPINCTLAESAQIAKLPLTPMSQAALDHEVEATFTNSTHPDTVSSIVSSARTCTETPRPDPIPILPHVKAGIVDVVAVGTYTPQWEEEKPFEFSDFIKYSAKHRAKQQTKTPSIASSSLPSPSPLVTASTTASTAIQHFHNSNLPGAFSHNNQTNSFDSSISPATPVPSSLDQPSNVLNESFLPDAPPVAGEFNSEMIDWYEEHLNKPTVV